MAFLYGEVPRPRKRELQEHLHACENCARQVRAWRQAMAALDACPAPAVTTYRKPRFQPMLRWAAAAAVVLVVGFLLGRATSASARQIRELQASVARLQQQQPSAEGQPDSATVRAVVEVASSETVKLLNEYTRVLGQEQARDRQATALAIRALEEQYLTLRTGLETLALNTQDGLQTTHQNLARLAAFSSAGESPANSQLQQSN